MTEQGVVLSVKNEFAKVRVGRNSACASCGKCGMTERQKHVDFYASNKVNAREGDTVVLDIPDANSAKLALYGYFIPIVPALGLLFLALGVKWPDWAAALMFIVGMAVGFAVVALIDKLRRHKWTETPQIVEIVHITMPKRTQEQFAEAESDNETAQVDDNTELNAEISYEQNNIKGDKKDE